MPKSAKSTAGTKTTKSVAVPIPPAISYRLSNKHFLDCGWTAKPNVSVGIAMVTMKARFSHRNISPWFREGKMDSRVRYANGKTLYFAKTNGTGKIFYPNGKLAVNIEKGGINLCRTRLWVYSPGTVGRDGIRHPPQLCALFDSFGNGVVYDHCMTKKLVYNQKEGIYLDRLRPVRWKWHNLKYTGSCSVVDEENEPDLICEAPKNIIGIPPIKEYVKTSNSECSSLFDHLTNSEWEFRERFELLKYIDTDRMRPRRVSPIKPIILPLNLFLTLKIWSQSEISLSFFALGRHTSLKIGVLYNPFDKLKVNEVDESTLSARGVICPFEQYPPKTKSICEFQKLVTTVRVECGQPPLEVSSCRTCN